MSDIKNLKGIELVRELSLGFGPSGCEDRVRDMMAECAEPLADKVLTDRMGNLICRMSFGEGEKRSRVMLCAHMDEVGFMIDGIRSDGMLTFGCIGGIDPSVVAGRKVLVGNEKGVVRGLICSKAIHHKDKKEREQAVKVDKLYIDVGFTSKEEAEKYIAIGDFATFDSEFYTFGKDGRTLKCKALDDRMGCAAMLEIMDRLKKEPIDADADVYFCFTVREEIGYSGAGSAAELIDPSLAIVLETTAISDLPETPPHKRVADVGSGAVISIADRATIYDRELVEHALDLAQSRGIKAQIKRYISGGNDAGKIYKRLCGIKTLAISVPTRYLHSPACVASLDDHEAVRDLAEAIVREHFERKK